MTELEKLRNQEMESLSKLQRIRKELRENPKVFYAGSFNSGKLYEDMFSSGKLDSKICFIVVSPKKPIFIPKKLNLFMDNLLKEKPTERSYFRLSQNGDLYLGMLSFEEKTKMVDKIIKINIYLNSDIAKFMYKYLKTKEKGSIVDLLFKEAVEEDGQNWIGVDAFDFESHIDKKLLKVLKKHNSAFHDNGLC